MKLKSLILFPLVGAALLLSACSTVSSRINEKGSVFYSLDPDTRAKIEHGDVALNFTPDMVYMALGKPDAKRHQTTADGTTETWIYGTYYYNDGYVGYRRWGGWGPRGYYRMYWEPAFAPAYSALTDEIRVTFRNGKVTTIDQAHS